MAEKKTATIYVNMKSITGGYDEKANDNDDDNTTTKPTTVKKTAKLRIEANGETIYNKDVDKNETKFNTGNNKLTGTGVVTVKVYIDDELIYEEDIYLNENIKKKGMIDYINEAFYNMFDEYSKI